jgi:hypothetical protein
MMYCSHLNGVGKKTIGQNKFLDFGREHVMFMK